MPDPTAPAITADSQAKDATNFANVKTFGDGPSMYLQLAQQALAQSFALAGQNAVTQQQAMQAIGNAATTAAVNTLLANTTVQGSVDEKIQNANLASQIQNMQTVLASGNQGLAGTQQAAGIANNTSTAGLAQAIAQLNATFNNQAQATGVLLQQLANGLAAALASLAAIQGVVVVPPAPVSVEIPRPKT